MNPIPVADIKPFPCIQPGSVTVVVEGGGSGSGEPGAVDNAAVNAAIGQNPEASRAALELGSAATQDSEDFATAEQGEKADSAVQPNTSPTLDNLTLQGDLIAGLQIRREPFSARISITGTYGGLQESSSGDVVVNDNAGGKYGNFCARGDILGEGIVQSAKNDAGGSFSVPSVKVGPNAIGLAHASDYGLSIIVGGMQLGWFDKRGGGNITFDVGYPYLVRGIFKPKTFTLSTSPDPSLNSYGQIVITDSSVTGVGDVVLDGGSSVVVARSNGTDWIVTEVILP